MWDHHESHFTYTAAAAAAAAIFLPKVQVASIGLEWRGLHLSLTGETYSSSNPEFGFPNQNTGASSLKSQIDLKASHSGDNFDDEVSV